MFFSQPYIVIAVIVILAAALLLFVIRRKSDVNRLSPFAGLAFAFIIAGIVFGDDQTLGYILMGIGLVLAVVDMIRR